MSQIVSDNPDKKPAAAPLRNRLALLFTGPVVRLIARGKISPNAVTWSGFIVTCGAAALIILGYPVIGGVVMLAAGYFDILDGALARLTGKVTPFGAVLDSTLDRVSEAVILVAILALYGGLVWMDVLIFLTLVGSYLVSYIRARSETMGMKGAVGIFTRTERVLVLAAGLLLSGVSYAMVTSLAVITVLSFFTAGQRLWNASRGPVK
jgi:CDP-diacylglycerol---glycerol-3-phosphate 3-phosphatidyltransferase